MQTRNYCTIVQGSVNQAEELYLIHGFVVCSFGSSCKHFNVQLIEARDFSQKPLLIVAGAA